MYQVELFKKYSMNMDGRDFICGDIHGHWKVVDQVLEKVNFDKTKDRLFSVGDLVDRGPQSIEYSDYLFQNWFHAVRGNHDHFPNQRDMDDSLRRRNGGQWFINEDSYSQNEIRLNLGTLPIAIEVETKRGRIGIVHADVPYDNWDFFTKSLVDWHEKIIMSAMWERSRWRYRDRDSNPVQMIDHVYVGHCAHDVVRHSHNVTDLDTGCGYEGGKLTLWSLDDFCVAAEGTY